MTSRRQLASYLATALFLHASVTLNAGCTALKSASDRPPPADASAVGDVGPSESDLGPALNDLGPDASAPDAGMPCNPDPNMRPVDMIGGGDAGAGVVEITSNTRWTCQNTYLLRSSVIVRNGAVLTIDPGTVIRAGAGVFLLVSRGSRLDAIGTVTQPIVFTSAKPAGMRAPGDWRGLVLLGAARSHDPTTNSVPATVGDPRGEYGAGSGGMVEPTCGTLRYVRVEFAGQTGSSPNDQPGAGLTFAGCGSDTVVEYVQAHRGRDGIGIYGGAVPLRRVIVSDAEVDSIEWTAGYTGTLQFVFVRHGGTGNALRGNNNENSPNNLPVSRPVVFNATLVSTQPAGAGSGDEIGIVLQHGSQGVVRNSVILGFRTWALDIRSAAIGAAFTADGLGQVAITNSLANNNGRGQMSVAQYPGGGMENDTDGEDDDNGFDEGARIASLPSPGRSVNNLNVQLPSVAGATPVFATTSNTVETGVNRANPDPGRGEVNLTSTNYVGAVRREQPGATEADWTQGGWTAFPAN